MGRKIANNQMTVFDLNLDGRNYVVQSNDFINGRQNLSLYAAKLLRAAIMQIKPEDTELKVYKATTTELADLLGTDRNNLYPTLDHVTDELMSKFIKINTNDEVLKIQWVEFCRYNKKSNTVEIQLYRELKPFLLELKKNYTQYMLQDILTMRSVYAIRLYELLQARVIGEIRRGMEIEIDLFLQEIRAACDIPDNKYTQVTGIKQRVIDIAIKEIERITVYKITYKNIKKGRSVVGFKFKIKLKI
jgi:plasmid replication initiation protein